MRLYGRRSSINVQKVLWCLAEIGLTEGRDFERIDAGLEFGIVDKREYRKLTPNGLVPMLVDGEFVLWESNSIVRYLVASRSDRALLPADPKFRADVERWMDWQLGTLWATLHIASLGLTRPPGAQRNVEAIQNAYREGSRMLTFVDALPGHQSHLTGEAFR